MLIDSNSTKEEISNYIKLLPCTFLENFSDDSWAKSHIDEAAKISVNRTPIYFLRNFSDKPWAQPYIDESVKMAAKQSPEYFLEKWANRFPQGINTALFALGGENRVD